MLYLLSFVLFYLGILDVESVRPRQKAVTPKDEEQTNTPYPMGGSGNTHQQNEVNTFDRTNNQNKEVITMRLNLTDWLGDSMVTTTLNNAYYGNFKLSEGYWTIEEISGLKDLSEQLLSEANEFFEAIIPVYQNEGYWEGYRQHSQYMSDFGIDPKTFPIFWSETGNKIQDMVTDRILELMHGQCNEQDLEQPFDIVMRYCLEGLPSCDKRGYNHDLHIEDAQGKTHIAAWVPMEGIYNHPLGLVDRSKLPSNAIGYEQVVYTPELKKQLSKDDVFYYYPHVKPGEVIFYDAGKTPHMAFPHTWGTGHQRSFEFHFYCGVHHSEQHHSIYSPH